MKCILLILLLTSGEVNLWAQLLIPAHEKNGMVLSTQICASDVGMEILNRGGNAVDAAIATGFALAVVYPQAGNIGGGGFMLIHPPGGKMFCLDYREKAPLRASPTMYLDDQGEVISDASMVGYLACGVPGTVAGFYEAYKKFGKLPWADLIQPAIDLADKGFRIDRRLALSLKDKLNILVRFPASSIIFSRRGEPFQENDTLIQRDLANTLRIIQSNGPSGYYQGPIADKIIETMTKNGGLISRQDLKAYQAIWRDPISFTYRQYSIHSVPPPSSGGILLAEIFNALENINVQQLGHNSSTLIHFWVEIERQAYADRSEYLGDPAFNKIPVNLLISKSYGKKIFNLVNPHYARSSTSVQPTVFESDQTTHYSVVDATGMAVSNTYTLNDSYGSGVVVDGTGILLNNEMDDFAIKSGYPNMFGLTGSAANAIAPAKRMLSSMSPTIVTRSDSTFLILGSPGGATIITTVAQVISNVIDHDMNIREAVAAPRFHQQWQPDQILYEKNGFSSDVLNILQSKGHSLKMVNILGDVQAIMWESTNQEWTGWSDPRKDGL